MCFMNIRILILLTSLLPFLKFQQIFENTKGCEFTKKYDNAKSSIHLESKLWNINVATQKNIFISPCEALPPKNGCDAGAVACILNPRNTQASISNAGKLFEYMYDKDKEKDVLRSVNGQPCSNTENFTVIIEFYCGPNTKTFPKYIYQSECELHLEMLSPTCTPMCTIREDGNLIDLRDLKNLGTLTVSNTKSFALSFCGEVPQCGAGISICETTTGISPLAKADTVSFSYNKESNILVFKGHWGAGKRGRLNSEVRLKCNWTVQGISKLEYVPVKPQGKNYHFIGETALACIKMPMNCMVVDPYRSSFAYDLTSLNNQQRAWRVANVSSGTIFINICGPLKTNTRNNPCTAQSSQVCLTDNRGQFFNLGSIAMNFRVTEDDTVKGVFTDGGICTFNSSKSYNTEIELICSSGEQGPILQKPINCTNMISWRTPAACPKNIASEDNCLMSDMIGNVNLNGIYKSSDTIYPLSPNSYLRYNLCGSLITACNNDNHTSVCYVNNGLEHIVGYTKKILLRDSTSLGLNLFGDMCDSSTRSAVRVHFVCNYIAPTSGHVRIKTIKENCSFEMDIETKLACVPPVHAECKLYSTDSLYNLAPLMRNSSNYEVQDSVDHNVRYSLNVCHSIVISPGLLCPANSGICMKNLTEPHIKRMYHSIGTIQQMTKLVIEDGKVVLHYSPGDMCRSELKQYTTKIQFECSHRDEGPQFLSKTRCSYLLLWRTPHACPNQILVVKKRSVHTNCVYINPVLYNKGLDLGVLNKDLHLTIGDESFIFNICENNYTRCIRNDTECESHSREGELLYNNDSLGLLYKLKENCSGVGDANKMWIQLVCGNKEAEEVLAIVNCTMYMKLTSTAACLKEYDPSVTSTTALSRLTIIPTLTKKYAKIRPIITEKYHEYSTPELLPETSMKVEVKDPPESINCSIMTTESVFKLNNVNLNITSAGLNNYSVAFGEKFINCNGYICKNGIEYLSRSTECPDVIYSEIPFIVKLLFNSHQICKNGKFDLELWLKCNSELQLPSVQESTCKIVIIYPTQEMCLTVENPVLLNNFSATGPTASIIIGIVMFLIFCAIMAVCKKYRPSMPKIFCNTFCKSKRYTRIYYKDSSL